MIEAGQSSKNQRQEKAGLVVKKNSLLPATTHSPDNHMNTFIRADTLHHPKLHPTMVHEVPSFQHMNFGETNPNQGKDIE
jgi:hypothetical protein